MILAVLFYTGLVGVLYGAFALLALTQFQHRRATGGRTLLSRRVVYIRSVATLLLVLALFLAIMHDGSGFGALLWITLASGTACMVALRIAWHPGLLIPLTRIMEWRFGLTGAWLRCL
ncbi:DUF3325 family protein [Acetobacter suratthaniensis]|uniref:DUF3325 family protein n=1 Tax=Acetobacter suratthaniensis TaxID=1502841 RepID=A0ABS3LNC1_9PROT|nr:DUF3325 family protein [Acetobacter suratthaniensis]